MPLHPLKAIAGYSSANPPPAPASAHVPRWTMSEPKTWSVDKEGTLRLTTDSNTDFWQRTHYGFRNDNASVLSLPGYADKDGKQADFVMTVGVRWKPAHQYDQSGIYIRASASCWVKASCEYESNAFPAGLGGVVTNSGFSDWSFAPVPNTTSEMYYRVRRRGPNYIIHASTDQKRWNQLRLFRLLEDDGVSPLYIGLYSCSPKEGGMEVEYFKWEVKKAEGEGGWDPYYDD